MKGRYCMGDRQTDRQNGGANTSMISHCWQPLFHLSKNALRRSRPNIQW